MLEVTHDGPAEPTAQKLSVHPERVIVTAPVRRGRPGPDADLAFDELRDARGSEEELRFDGTCEEHVVVRVQEVLGKALDAVHLRFHGVRIVGGQH